MKVKLQEITRRLGTMTTYEQIAAYKVVGRVTADEKQTFQTFDDLTPPVVAMVRTLARKHRELASRYLRERLPHCSFEDAIATLDKIAPMISPCVRVVAALT